jgi:hypothetical protein
MSKTILVDGMDISRAGDGALRPVQIQLPYADTSSVVGYSLPITTPAKEDLINLFLKEMLDRHNKADDTQKAQIANEPVSVIFGKQILLFILAQEGCEGINFSFGKKMGDDGQLHTTLIAEGVGQDKDGNAVKLPKASAAITKGNVENIIGEMVPPYTFGQLLDAKEKGANEFNAAYSEAFLINFSNRFNFF